jgi:type II secretory pathway pseudopilin PulG
MLHSRRSAFTLIEIMLFAALFAVSTVGMMLILIAITRVQVRQSASVEVAGQSQRLLQIIQQNIEQSLNVELPTDVATTTLKLRMAANADPTYIYTTGNIVYIKQTDGGTPQALTSDLVRITELTFVKRANDRGKDSVAVNFTMAFNTSNLQQSFVHVLDTGIARVSAATFDSDIRASSTNTYKLGTATQEWKSINDTVYFGSAANVGIGVTPASSGVKLQVSGGHIYPSDAQSGIIFKAPNGSSCYLLGITNVGQFQTSSVSCP